MDLVSTFAPILGLAIFIERIMEVIWNTVEAITPISFWKKLKATATAGSTDPKDYEPTDSYVKFKQISSVIISLILGVFLANNFGFGFLSLIPNLPENLKAVGQGLTLGIVTDTFLAGIIAGTAAPYSHQVIEALLNFQKFLEAQKNLISGKPV